MLKSGVFFLLAEGNFIVCEATFSHIPGSLAVEGFGKIALTSYFVPPST
jgi:hypothetical protein